MSSLKRAGSDLNRRIARRVRELRTAQGLSLDGLAAQSGVSRSMLSLIERGEASPTAVVLEKLATGLRVMLASLFDAPNEAADSGRSPVARREDQPEWQDPGSGYIRRNVSPASVPQPMQIVEVDFPPGGRVNFETGAREQRVYQQIWLLKGVMEISFGREHHRLREGDCLAMELNQPTVFYNPTRKRARFAVVFVCERPARR